VVETLQKVRSNQFDKSIKYCKMRMDHEIVAEIKLSNQNEKRNTEKLEVKNENMHKQ
jgi:hypothetical protein